MEPPITLIASQLAVEDPFDEKRDVDTAREDWRTSLREVRENGFIHAVTEAIEEREQFPPIINESGNGLKNQMMTVAMARFNDPHSATNQFYFNLADNASLDPNRKSWGYAVFGEVIGGWDVVMAIAGVQTGYSEALDAEDVPVTPVKLIKATVLETP